MSASLKGNAYHILGLDTSATSRHILQRSNEILQRLKIDDCPSYPLDIKCAHNFRTDATVSEALRKLQSPKSRIAEHFFWFSVTNDVDALAARALATNDGMRAAKIWNDASLGDPNRNWHYKRQSVVAGALSLLDVRGKESLRPTILEWKRLVESSDFWTSFARSYKLDETHSVTDLAIQELRQRVPGYLSDIFAEIEQTVGSSGYIFEFQRHFSAKGEKLESDVVGPVFRSIETAITKLDAIDLGEEVAYVHATAANIRTQVLDMQRALNTLIDAGLYDHSDTKAVRDRAANSIRRIVLALHNDHQEISKSFQLLGIARDIAGTESLRTMLGAERSTIEENIKTEDTQILRVVVPGIFGGGTAIFDADAITYNGRRIAYKDTTKIAFHSLDHSVNFIPISQSYNFMVASSRQKLSISLGTTLYIGSSKMKDAWAKLAAYSMHLMAPRIVENLVERIFDRNETLTIGSVEFARSGYTKYRMLRNPETVSWQEVSYPPTFSSGNVVLWKEIKNRASEFATISMNVPNAVVMQELVKACVTRAGSDERK
jgi:hypothetical protein